MRESDALSAAFATSTLKARTIHDRMSQRDWAQECVVSSACWHELWQLPKIDSPARTPGRAAAGTKGRHRKLSTSLLCTSSWQKPKLSVFAVYARAPRGQRRVPAKGRPATGEVARARRCSQYMAVHVMNALGGMGAQQSLGVFHPAPRRTSGWSVLNEPTPRSRVPRAKTRLEPPLRARNSSGPGSPGQPTRGRRHAMRHARTAGSRTRGLRCATLRVRLRWPVRRGASDCATLKRDGNCCDRCNTRARRANGFAPRSVSSE